MARKQPAAVRQKQRVRLAYLILTASAVLIGLSIAGLQHHASAGQAQTVKNATVPETTGKSGSVSQEKIAEQKTVSSSTAVKPAVTPVKGRIVLLVDDVGNNLEELEPFLKLPMALTFAVMPGRAYTRESVDLIKAAGKSVIMHQPMEPVGDANPGDGAIYAGMSQEEIYTILDDNLHSLGGALGLNNHMGSKVTADYITMKYILSYLKEKGMFFVDSLTTGESVAEDLAAEMDVPFLERNSMFLDNKRERDYVERALRSGFSIAEKSGRAVMIGHIWDEHLAELLLELFPEFTDAGFTFDDVGNMIYLGQQDTE